MSQTTPRLETQKRDKIGTRYARRLRDEGRLPIVIYGHGHDPVHASVDTREFHGVVSHHAHLVEVMVDGQATPCLLKDVQYDYLDRDPVHADLAIVNLDEDVEVEVGLELTGDAVGLKTSGAMLDQLMTTLAVRCKANNIPEMIEHDISALDVGGSIHVSDLAMPTGVAAVDEDEKLVAHIAVQAEKPEPDELDADAEAASDEPEVIDKGKKEEGEGDEKE